MKIQLLITLAALGAAGCAPTIKTQNEITLKPVQVTVDVNVNLKVDQALTDALNEKKSGAPANGVDAERQARRQRFESRRDQLNAWKLEKKIGENNRGFIELRLAPSEVTGDVMMLITEENNDRTAMYQNIARSQNNTAEFVGQRSAILRGQKAAKGTLVQQPDGSWTEVTGEEK